MSLSSYLRSQCISHGYNLAPRAFAEKGIEFRDALLHDLGDAHSRAQTVADAMHKAEAEVYDCLKRLRSMQEDYSTILSSLREREERRCIEREWEALSAKRAEALARMDNYRRLLQEEETHIRDLEETASRLQITTEPAVPEQRREPVVAQSKRATERGRAPPDSSPSPNELTRALQQRRSSDDVVAHQRRGSVDAASDRSTRAQERKTGRGPSSKMKRVRFSKSTAMLVWSTQSNLVRALVIHFSCFSFLDLLVYS